MDKFYCFFIILILYMCPFVSSVCYLDETDVVCVKSTEDDFVIFGENLRKDVDTLFLILPLMSEIREEVLNFPHLKKIHRLTIEKSEIGSIGDGAFNGYDHLDEFTIFENSEEWEILAGTFSGASNLRNFVAYNAGLYNIEPGSFMQTPLLKELILYYNNFEELKTGTFIGLKKLFNLEITRGQLHSISPGAFFGLESLAYLSLEFNELTYLEDDVFEGLEELRRLNLSGNNLRFLNYIAFRGLKNVYYLDLSYTGINTVDMNELQRYMPKLEVVILT